MATIVRTVAAVLVLAGCSEKESGLETDPLSSGGGSAAVSAAPTAGNGASAAGSSAPSGGGDTAGAGSAGSNAPAGGSSAAAGTSGEEASAGSGGSDGAPAADGTVSVIATMQLHRPTDLEFNPYVEDELWVMNYADSSVAIIANASTEARSVERRLDPEAARHFMPQPSAFAFGARETSFVDAQGMMVEGTFATCPETDQDFMGPSLWTSDLRIFAITKRDREPPFNGADTGGEGPGSHLDMLHRTPSCTGIAWEGTGNVYWTYSGTRSMFVKYDFAQDHGIGNTDHSDGSVWRYPVTGVEYFPTIPSHLQYEPQSGLLYMADTGNGRVVTFDPATATESSAMSVLENVDRLQEARDLSGGQLQELVASSYGLKAPSGLEIHEQSLYVSDNETSTIHKFALDGAPLDMVAIADVARGGLAGLAFGPDGKLYFVDMIGERVLRLEGEF